MKLWYVSPGGTQTFWSLFKRLQIKHPALRYVVHPLQHASVFITVVQNKEALPIDGLGLYLCLVLSNLCDLNDIT